MAADEDRETAAVQSDVRRSRLQVERVEELAWGGLVKLIVARSEG